MRVSGTNIRVPRVLMCVRAFARPKFTCYTPCTYLGDTWRQFIYGAANANADAMYCDALPPSPPPTPSSPSGNPLVKLATFTIESIEKAGDETSF